MSRRSLKTPKRSDWPFLDGSPLDQHRLIASGLSVKELQGAIDWFSNSRKHMVLRAIGISSSTLRRKVPQGMLSLHHSNSLFALGSVVTLAERVLGSRELAEAWLTSSCLSLQGEQPLNLVTTFSGIQSVKELLECIEYGVYS